MEPLIKIDALSKWYGDFQAVKDLTLSVNPGEVFGFLGMNGAGKTTTIRMLAGVLRPSKGTITICGYNLAKDAEAAKRLTGYVPDRPYLYPKLTGREFLTFVGDLYEVPKKDRDERIEQLLKSYRLLAYEHQLIEGYSHGMKQRLATCASLIHKPRVLIVDEPMVGLDPHGARLLKQSLRNYAAQGMAVFLSTHSLNVAEEVCDRVGIMHQGSLVAIGTVSDLRSQQGSSEHKNLEQIFLEITADEMNELTSLE